MCELPISHATHLAGGTLSLTRSAILLNGDDRPIFLRYRTSRAVTIRPVVTVFQFPPSAQQKTPIDFNRRSGTLMIFESIGLWTGHKGSGIIVVQCQGESRGNRTTDHQNADRCSPAEATLAFAAGFAAGFARTLTSHDFFINDNRHSCLSCRRGGRMIPEPHRLL